jgi:hypothetical protein
MDQLKVSLGFSQNQFLGQTIDLHASGKKFTAW